MLRFYGTGVNFSLNMADWFNMSVPVPISNSVRNNAMEMSGEHQITAPRQQVWDALNDPEVLKACITGCESVEKLSDTEMTAVVVAKVGPVKAKFKGKVTLSDVDAPNGYTISGEGQGGVAGFGKGSAEVSLADSGDGTVLNYTAKASVGGKLAQLGSRLVDATAAKMADEFFTAFAKYLEPETTGDEAEPVAAVVEGPDNVTPAASGGIPTWLWAAGLIAVVAAILIGYSD
jgi:uncharacterized protein